jgi:glycerate 2-kinase
MTRAELCSLFQAAVARLDPARLVGQRLRRGDFRPGRVVAVGKAAQSMIDGCPEEWPRLVISPHPARDRNEVESSHPFLSAASYAAGQRLLDFLSDDPLLLLVSGGASALVEVCPPGQQPWLEGWARLYAAGLDIVSMNRERARHSAIKGGKLLDFLRAPSLTLLLSDVLQGPQWVGSGLTWRSPQPEEHRIEVLADASALVREMIRGLSGYRCRTQEPFTGSLDLAVQAIRGWSPAPGEAWLASSEVTLAVRGEGAGGRCQHLAASLVDWLRDKPYLLLAAASDGVDGHTPVPCAGACVDGSFPDPDSFLSRQDSYAYFQSMGQVWAPGPTGNNLNDLIVLLNPRT